MKSSTILLRAAELIEIHGHAKGIYQTKDGRLCASGAMRLASGTFPDGVPPESTIEDFRRAYSHLTTWLSERDEIGGVVYSIPSWNDDGNRTPDEVLMALRSVADICATQGD